ncbi:MAG: diacylglycerol/lipid kinase family protein [Barnesiella sp.]
MKVAFSNFAFRLKETNYYGYKETSDSYHQSDIGTRHKEDLPTVIREELDSNAFSTEIIMTQYTGHAEELTRKAVDDGIDYVLAVGGDGTCNEVSRGLINSSTALGIIPVGSGNGLAVIWAFLSTCAKPCKS